MSQSRFSCKMARIRLNCFSLQILVLERTLLVALKNSAAAALKGTNLNSSPGPTVFYKTYAIYPEVTRGNPSIPIGSRVSLSQYLSVPPFSVGACHRLTLFNPWSYIPCEASHVHSSCSVRLWCFMKKLSFWSVLLFQVSVLWSVTFTIFLHFALTVWRHLHFW